MEIRKYTTDTGAIPFDDWLSKLRDSRAKARILVRLDRVRLGNFGDHKTVGEGVSELRIPEGQGYRVYYAREGDTVVILLCGGDKSSQSQDIKLAKEYWNDYRRRTYGH